MDNGKGSLPMMHVFCALLSAHTLLIKELTPHPIITHFLSSSSSFVHKQFPPCTYFILSTLSFAVFVAYGSSCCDNKNSLMFVHESV